ncbi:hypothetical protein BKA81DRAFT_141687 [Phyllosticta paracitricarpa]
MTDAGSSPVAPETHPFSRRTDSLTAVAREVTASIPDSLCFSLPQPCTVIPPPHAVCNWRLVSFFPPHHQKNSHIPVARLVTFFHSQISRRRLRVEMKNAGRTACVCAFAPTRAVGLRQPCPQPAPLSKKKPAARENGWVHRRARWSVKRGNARTAKAK